MGQTRLTTQTNNFGRSYEAFGIYVSIKEKVDFADKKRLLIHGVLPSKKGRKNQQIFKN